jgi:hypothetical protein
MLAFELRKNASDVDAKITATKESLEQLTRRHDSIEPTTSLGEIEQLIQNIKNHEAKLEKLQLLRMAIQKKLNEYANNASKKKPLVEDGGAAHERGRDIFLELAKHQADVRVLVKELDEKVNVTMSTKAKDFENLTGENMGLPLSMVCYPAAAFALAETIRPYDPWKYVSEAESKTEHQRMEIEQFKRYQDRLAVANKVAPPCARCGEKTVVDMHAGMKETPGAGIIDGHWSFHCNSCGNGQGGVVPETKRK